MSVLIDQIRTIPRTTTLFKLPEEGVDLPTTISLPPATVSRQAVIDFGNALGIDMPVSFNRQRLIERMSEALQQVGYETLNGTILIRKQPIHLVEARTDEYELNDLVTPEVYTQFMRNPEEVVVSQEDLIRLNTPFSSILASLSREKWPSFREFIDDLSSILGISPELATMATLLGQLPRKSSLFLSEILQPNEQLNSIYDYFRSKLQLVPRDYVRRDHFQGPALTTMSFMKAIDQGYQFEPDQYQEEIDDLLNETAVPSSQRKFLVDVIQLYPEIFSVMRQYDSTGTSLATSLIQLYYPEIPSKVQVLYAFAVNYPLIFTESEEKKTRRQELNKLPRVYLQTLYGIYQTNNMEIILDTPQHPLELYLLAIPKLKQDQLSTLVAGFGMIVPEHLLMREIRGYVLLWMPQYRQIATRASPVPSIYEAIPGSPISIEELIDQLAIYTDQEIITFFGYTGSFDTRNALIESIFRTITETGFMLYKKIEESRTLNVETTMSTPIQDLMSPYLVFGTAFNYRVHELDELIQTWSEGRGFRRIDGEGNYTIPQVSRLQSLLPLMKNMNSQLSTKVDQIINRIQEGILSTMRRSAEVDEVLRGLRHSTESIRDLVKQIFYKIFYAGMYMRKWKGPGNKYPSREVQTQITGPPLPKVSMTLGELYELLYQLRRQDERLADDLERVPEISYHTEADDIVIQRARLFDMIQDIFMGKHCIQHASKTLITSAHYYLAVGFQELIPDFSPYEVDTIS